MGMTLRQHTLLERRASLKALLGSDDQSRIQFSDEFVGDGDALFKACAEQELEGIVSKHSLAPYRSGRSRTWLKTKCFTESIFVVIGTDRDRKTGALRALLAHKDSGGLGYAGAAFIALAGDERARFFAELERLATSWATFKGMHDVKWCHPKLTVEVKHLAGSKFLRHATVRGGLSSAGPRGRQDFERIDPRTASPGATAPGLLYVRDPASTRTGPPKPQTPGFSILPAPWVARPRIHPDPYGNPK
jgi:ATP-dependent DNA ligase